MQVDVTYHNSFHRLAVPGTVRHTQLEVTMKGPSYRYSSVSPFIRFVFSIATIGFLFQFSPHALAQPELNIHHITVDWPTVGLHITARCDSQLSYDVQKQNFRLYEDGREIEEFELLCPGDRLPCPISAALVFDVSGSMSGAGNAAAKAGGHAFIDKMDGIADEASIITFNDRVSILQQMTTIKPMLHSAVDAFGASGGTALWNAAWEGVQYVAGNGYNYCRAVVVMTDGVDGSSTRTMPEVVDLAKQHDIPVHTIGYGIQSFQELEQLALQTGGTFYKTQDPGEIPAIYEELYDLFNVNDHECLITYDTQGCANGSYRTVELQLHDFCTGSDTSRMEFQLPFDMDTWSVVRFKFADVEVQSGEEVLVPLDLVTDLNPGDQLSRMTFSVIYNADTLTFVDVTVPPGSIFEGVPIYVTPLRGLVTVETGTPGKYANENRLLEFRFRAGETDSAVSVIIYPRNLMLPDAVCYYGIMDAGEILILPDVTSIDFETPPLPEATLTVYPAPSSGLFTVDIKSDSRMQAQIVLFDMMGREVFRGSPFEITGDIQRKVNAKHLAPGTYMLRVQLGAQSLYRKITKER